MNRQETSKQACAKYARLRGDEPQQNFRMALNLFIMRGCSVSDAEVEASGSCARTTPGFTPLRAGSEGSSVGRSRECRGS
jgi:hypothetical protein